jgi:Flp pilus assembly protein TadG
MAAPQRASRLRPTATRRRRRGSQYIEFLILLPFWIFMMFFLVGIGEMVLVHAGLQDATQQIARAGAQQGGLDWDGTLICNATAGASTSTSGTGCASAIYQQFVNNVAAMPGGNVADIVSVEAVRGGNFACSAANPYVTVTVTYGATFDVPLMNAFMSSVNPNYTITTSATARCEIGIAGG